MGRADDVGSGGVIHRGGGRDPEAIAEPQADSLLDRGG